MNKRQISLFEQAVSSLDPLTQHKLVRTFSRRLAEQTGKVIGARAGLLGQCLKREVLAEMVLNEISHPFYLLRRQPLRRFLDGFPFRRIMTQEMNGEQLSGALRIQFAGGRGLFQFSPESKSDLAQQWVMKASMSDQREVCGIEVRH